MLDVFADVLRKIRNTSAAENQTCEKRLVSSADLYHFHLRIFFGFSLIHFKKKQFNLEFCFTFLKL